MGATPFTYVFGPNPDDWFQQILEEAEEAHKAWSDRGQFASLTSVQQLLAQIESPDTVETDPAAAAEYLLFLYVAFRFWQAGQPVYPLTAAVIGSDMPQPLSGRTVVVPHHACYLQFAEQTFWGQIDIDAPHEPIDGIFVADSPQGQELTAVAILGFRPEREGFSQVGITVARDDLSAAIANVRPQPFTPVMDGGQRAGFHSLVSTSELLLLVQLALAHVANTATPR